VVVFKIGGRYKLAVMCTSPATLVIFSSSTSISRVVRVYLKSVYNITMEKAEYCLVNWKAENKFSVIPRTKIVEAKYRDLIDSKLIGKTVLCVWMRKKPYLAEIIQTGNVMPTDL